VVRLSNVTISAAPGLRQLRNTQLVCPATTSYTDPLNKLSTSERVEDAGHQQLAILLHDTFRGRILGLIMLYRRVASQAVSGNFAGTFILQ
jgi:hypothetical protein